MLTTRARGITAVGTGAVITLLVSCCAGPSEGATLPGSLVGTWCGGGDTLSGQWTFAEDGRFEATTRAVSWSGTASVNAAGDTLTTMSDGGQMSYSFTMDVDPTLGPMLYLNGYSYLAGAC